MQMIHNTVWRPTKGDSQAIRRLLVEGKLCNTRTYHALYNTFTNTRGSQAN